MTPEQAEEQVRQDAADRMQHNTTSDLSARLMCRVGFRELTLLLAHYDGLKRAHADRASDKPLRIPVDLDEAQLPQPSRIIEPVTPETVFRVGDRVRARNPSIADDVANFQIGDWLTIRKICSDGSPILTIDPPEDDEEDYGWDVEFFDRIERAP